MYSLYVVDYENNDISLVWIQTPVIIATECLLVHLKLHTSHMLRVEFDFTISRTICI